MRHQGKWGMQDWPCQKEGQLMTGHYCNPPILAPHACFPDGSYMTGVPEIAIETPSTHDRSDDVKTLMSKAIEALWDALQDGIRQGKQPGEWRTQSIADHLHHGFLHNYKYRWCGAPSTEHLTHAVCRAVMAYTLHMEKK